MPELRFETHFQSDGLPVPVHKRIVIAVSGGSDSLALLHLLHDWQLRSEQSPDLFIATVDHGLRREAAEEAEYVSEICRGLGLSHAILTWQKPSGFTSSSAASREARYELLCAYAREIGATCIVLGHTLDDQAETVLMRASRRGSSRGLSGMPQRAHYALADWRVCLFRPLLGVRRHELRDYLSGLGVRWINDPSNQNPESERVRVRDVLETCDSLPAAESIAKLADLSARLRSFSSEHVAKLLVRSADAVLVKNEDSQDVKYTFRPPGLGEKSRINRRNLTDAFAVLILAAGGKSNRVSQAKLQPLIDGYVGGKRVKANLGRCIVTTGKHGARFEREQRNLDPVPCLNEGPVVYDGRWLLQSDQGSTELLPFINGLERFLPASDFPIHRAMMKIARRLT